MPHAWTLLELKNGPLTVNHLAERLNIDRTNVSRLCIKMEDLGEIRRIPNPEDGRSKVLELTEKGSRLANQVDRSSAEHFSRVLEALPNPNTVLHALDQLIAAFQAEASEENP
jgi:putative acetyltransferase